MMIPDYAYQAAVERLIGKTFVRELRKAKKADDKKRRKKRKEAKASRKRNRKIKS